ncbi:hypothetical protein AWB74_07594 [Caballeronia arvi]|uniref:Uncharacterized protein n=1 Tax=Caballeronia arvi TaxID=1777135 RepID=A0A158KYH3_9BURK|nr:hypothetical protein AWB74_07594 [Caballeronia arvi]
MAYQFAVRATNVVDVLRGVPLRMNQWLTLLRRALRVKSEVG